MMPSQGLSSKRPRTAPPSPATPPADGADLLSSLPTDMLNEILRRLTVKDAFRTSVLAKPWRFRWANCPGLEFVFNAGGPPAAVDAVLAGYACTVSRAQLAVAAESYGKTDGWLRALAAKGVRNLNLCFSPLLFRRYSLLPASLFSCSELTSLALKSCDIPPLPSSFNGFPNLAALHLEVVIFLQNGESTLEALITMSPSLSTLDILYPTIDSHDGGHFKEWTIRAPNLNIFSIRSWLHDYGWKLDELPLLEEVIVDLEGPELQRILPGMTRVQKLFIDVPDDTILEPLPSHFRNLKDLSFHTFVTKSSQILLIFCIQRNAPSLEDLYIKILRKNENIEVDMEVLNSQWTVGLFANLRSFHLCAIMGQQNEMQFIEFILSKATKLQKIELYVHDDRSKSMVVVSNELSEYKKASPYAEVIINRFPVNYVDESVIMKNLEAYDE